MRKIHQLLKTSFCIVFFSAEAVLACEFHGDDYGFGGGYTGRPWQSSLSAHRPLAATPQWLKLEMPTLLKANLGEAVVLDIAYEQIGPASDVEVTLNTFPEIPSIAEYSALLANVKGLHSVSFTPHKSGTYRVEVTAKTKTSDSVKTKEDVLYLNISANVF